MGDCRGRARTEASRGRRDTPSVEAKLKKWGECAGQESMFEDEELLTPEIREWRENGAS